MRVLLNGGLRRPAAAWGSVLILAAAACGKAKSDGASPDAGAAGASAAGGASAGSSAQAGASAGTGTHPDPENDGGAAGEQESPALGASNLRRLTTFEYSATVTDLLGTKQATDFPGFASEVDGFDNNAAANGVSDALYSRYLETAESLADEVFTSEQLRPIIVTCPQADDAACVRQIIAGAGLRLFRRPLLDEEIAVYQPVYASARARGDSHENAAKEVLSALLASAQFVFRMELAPNEPGSITVGPYELAARLSYLLWSSAPDAQLLDAAARGEVSSDEQLANAVARLLNDPKSKRFALSFAGHWLRVHRLSEVSFQSYLFPQWTPQLASAAADEVEAYFYELMGENQSWLGFLDSRAHFVTPDLANLYGLNVTGPGTQRVELPGVDRRGILGLVGFLAQTSEPTRSAPSQRGDWIARTLLCAALPDPPGDMPVYTYKESSIRDQLNGVNLLCPGCHVQIDPFGLALENYDAIGRYRSQYQDLTVIDAQVTLPPSIESANASAAGIAGLSAALANSSAFPACTAQKLYTYGFGRTVTESERSNVQAILQRWQAGPPTLRALILDLVQSPAFRGNIAGGQP
jgi:hypothetical protein